MQESAGRKVLSVCETLMCSSLSQTETKQAFYLHIPLMLSDIHPGAVLKLPSSFLYIATSIPQINVPCSPLDYCSPHFAFFLLCPSSTYKSPKLSSAKRMTLWELSSKLKGNTLFTVAVVTEGEKKKFSELLTNVKHDMVDQPSHTTQMFPADKNILVTAKF